MAADQAWETNRDDILNVVADIDLLASDRIQYAFLAGWKAGQEGAAALSAAGGAREGGRMSDLTIGYIVHDGTYAIVEDRTFVARCSNRQQAERVRAALSAADELARCRQALAFYANIREYNRVGGDPPGSDPPILWDKGFKARAALAAASPTTADGGSDELVGGEGG